MLYIKTYTCIYTRGVILNYIFKFTNLDKLDFSDNI